MSPEIRPIAVKSQQYSQINKEIIANKICRLLKEDIMENSTSLWCAQLVVTRNKSTSKKCLCVDCGQTVHKLTYLNAYSFPCIDNTICQVSLYIWSSTLDLQSTYHQVELLLEEQRCILHSKPTGNYIITRGCLSDSKSLLLRFNIPLTLSLLKTTTNMICIFRWHNNLWTHQGGTQSKPLFFSRHCKWEQLYIH